MDSDSEQTDEEESQLQELEEIDPAIRRPLVRLDRRIPGCVCERCRVMVGQAQRCCGKNKNTCYALTKLVTRVLEAERYKNRMVEAINLGVPVAKCHRHHCYVELQEKYKLVIQMRPRRKLPNCVELRVKDAFPCPNNDYVGFKYAQGQQHL